MRVSGLTEDLALLSRRAFSAALIVLAVTTSASAVGLYVDASCGSDTNTGTDPNCAMAAGPKLTIQAAIDVAVVGDVILVAPGTYNEVIDLLGKAITLRSSDGAVLTIIDGTGLDDSVVTCETNEGPDTIIEGFTITGGAGVACPWLATARCGGGLSCTESAPTIVSCVFRDNQVADDGGGAYGFRASPHLIDCVFDQNTAGGNGGGFHGEQGAAVLERCRFSQNTASFGGGGAAVRSGGTGRFSDCEFTQNEAIQASGGAILSSSQFLITNTVFMSNTAAKEGGAIYQFGGSHLTVVGSLFAANTAIQVGGAIQVDGLANATAVTLTNSTVVGNTSSRGGGVSVESAGVSVIANSIIWGNQGTQLDTLGVGGVLVRSSVVQGGLGDAGVVDGGGNSIAQPLFRSPNDFRLTFQSPCIDAGDNTAPGLSEVIVDLDGGARLYDVSWVVDTGIGTSPIVDMGAYEFGDCGDLAGPDCDNDGIPDTCAILGNDCNGNNTPDRCDTAAGIEPDCDGNGLIDYCETADRPSIDRNENGVPDACDIANGLETDCNDNQQIDSFEVADGTVEDCNGNAVPDSCDIVDLLEPDCNGNSVIDYCEVADGRADDCDGDGIPDGCAILADPEADCDLSGVLDTCELASDGFLDCNKNAVLDSCDLASGFSPDVDGNGIPDECCPVPCSLLLLPESSPIDKPRFISFVVPTDMPVGATAIRVQLVSLYHPNDPQPMGQLDYSAREGEFRYLNALLDGNGNPVYECLSSPAFGTTYACATVGCQPEYRDWASIFGGRDVHVTGNAIIPDSRYVVVQLPTSCAGAEETCDAGTEDLVLTTARFGDTNGDGLSTITDVVNTLDVVRNSYLSILEIFVYVRHEVPIPQLVATNTTDIVLSVDAVKLSPYLLPVNACP